MKIDRAMREKIILFGTGRRYQRFRTLLKKLVVAAIVDNAPEKQGKILDGHLIEAPKRITEIDYDYILILAKAESEICEQLRAMGVAKDRILTLERLGSLSDFYSIDFGREETILGTDIVLLSHGLDLSGAPLMLLNAATMLKRMGYTVSVIALSDGPLRQSYEQEEISVAVFYFFHFQPKYLEPLLRDAKFLFVNTLLFYPYIREVECYARKIIWWLHEEEDAYGKKYALNIEARKEVTFPNIKIYGVGDRVKNAFLDYFPKDEIGELLYGIEEQRAERTETESAFVFAMIGTVDERKGEDLFREAIRRLREEYSDIAFWVVGKISSPQEELFSEIEGVRLFGELEHKAVMRLFPRINAVVCPSRNDPMPVVVAEGMMQKKICIVSDHVGQAAWMTDGKNGFVCRSDDARSLYEKMKAALEHRELAERIGENAYQLYLEHFSMDAFAERLSRVLEEAMQEVLE